jgi:3-oxoacyl-[acyl-carrier protein] reductase
MDPAEFRRVVDVNLVGLLAGVHTVVPPMTAAGGGSIVNVSSIEGIAARPAVRLQREQVRYPRDHPARPRRSWGRSGIRVNSVHPGGVMTSMALTAAEVMTGVDPAGFLKSLPIARFAEPIEISRLVAFLASDESSTAPARVPADGGPALRAGVLRWASLDGEVAVVTGAGQGLGAAEAVALAGAGARVVLNDLPGRGSTRWRPASGTPAARAAVCPGDVAEWSTGEALLSAFGGLDILVNNAGILRDRMVFSMSEQEWDTVIRVHLRGHFETTRLATAYWRDLSKTEQRPVYARIVNTSSEAFLLGSAGQPNYAAAKAGIVGLTLATARWLRQVRRARQRHLPARPHRDDRRLMGPAPDGSDPMSPERVTPLVSLPGGPAGERHHRRGLRGHSDVVALLAPPAVRASFHASGPQWTTAELDATLGKVFIADPPRPGFVCLRTRCLWPAGPSGGERVKPARTRCRCPARRPSRSC